MDKITRKARSSFLPKISEKFLKIVPKIKWRGSNPDGGSQNATAPPLPVSKPPTETLSNSRPSPVLNPNPPPKQTRSTTKPNTSSHPQPSRPTPRQPAQQIPQAQSNNATFQGGYKQRPPGAPVHSPGSQPGPSNPFNQPNGTLRHSRRCILLSSLTFHLGSIFCDSLKGGKGDITRIERAISLALCL